ncbi:MAG: M28 family metallopeptidase [Acidobacteriota bacterium]
MKRISIVLSFALFAQAFPAVVRAQRGPSGSAAIRPDAIRAHMQFLADDLLEGRGTGTRGFHLAAKYVAAQYEAMGLTSRMQIVPFRKAVALDSSSIVLERAGSPPITLRYAEGFMTSGDPLREDATADASVVFAGYGITSPERKYDDYAGLDVRGKIVALMSGAPDDFPTDLRAHYSASLTKAEGAVTHGAIGVLNFNSAYAERMYNWSRVVRQSKLGSMYWLDAAGAPRSAFSQIGASASLSHEGAEQLFAGSGHTVDEVQKGTVKPFTLPVRARLHIASRFEPVESENVIGVLTGSDPVLKNEYVVYSAHLDHLGISEPVNGDSINNGALDNASGIAAMLEVAHAFTALATKPRRSILFLATTGEEKGLRGADYFANNPTVPLASIVADINIDEILMFVPARDVVQLGAEHSTLEDVLKKAGKKLGIDISPDPYPAEVGFVRSDQYPFVKRGVPSVYVGAGYHSVDPKQDAGAAQMKWVETVYHSPMDDMSQKIDFSIGAQVALFDFEVGLEVANGSGRPRWKKGDFFGEKFGRPKGN